MKNRKTFKDEKKKKRICHYQIYYYNFKPKRNDKRILENKKEKAEEGTKYIHPL